MIFFNYEYQLAKAGKLAMREGVEFETTKTN